jgi:chemotaxis regulatin CheY-phosphate phosphatase CheZ
MKSGQIEKIIRKVEELKALFIFGQRVMPFLEDLFYFVQEIAPLLDEINAQLKESSRKMPKAASQLSKVTEATEMATTEILDMVDGIIFKVNGIQTNLNRFKSYSDLQDDLSNRIQKRLSLLEQKYPNDPDIKSMKELWEKVDQSGNILDPLQSSQNYMNEIRQLSSNIMIALQVQDITAQQIASVNHLIESVQEKLSTLLSQLDSENLPELTEAQKVAIKKVAFDSNAVYTKAGERQHIADEIISQVKSTPSVDEIVNEQKEEHVVETKKEEKKTETTDDFDIASQDDIDALFK